MAADIFTWFLPTFLPTPGNLAYEHFAVVGIFADITIVLHTQELYNYKNVKPL